MDNNMENYVEETAKLNISKIHTSMPGTITSFDAGTCTATVSPCLKYFVTDGRVLDFPAISRVPVFMPRAGATQITYPVKSGDSCWIVFSERSMDEWSGYSGDIQHDNRQYDLTDAVAFVGMCPTQSISAENVELINSGTKVSVTPGGDVNITGNVNISGNLTISGTTVGQGDVIGGGISLISHTHPYHHGSTGSAQ